MNEFGLPPQSFPPAPPAGTAIPGSMTFGQILDRVIQLLRANWRLFVAIGLVPGAAIIAYFGIILAAFFPVLRLLMQRPTVGFSAMKIASLGTSFALAYFVAITLMIVVVALYEPAAAYAALEANTGTNVTFGKAWAVSWSRAGRYIWLSILRLLIVALPILVFAAVIAGTVVLAMAHARSATSPTALVGLFPLLFLVYLGAIVYAVLAMLRLALAVPACVVEDLSAWMALRRSNQLTSGARGRIFLLALLIYAIAYAAFLVVEMVILFVGAMAALVGMMLHLAMAPWGYIGIGAGVLVFLCIYLIWYACMWAAYSTMFAVVYHDQRPRLDGIAAANAG
jgi:hypothetical protein